VRGLGLAYATLAREHGLKRIAVGRDGRLDSPALEEALVEGLVAGGMEVERLGLCTSPKLAFAVSTYRLDGAIMVTASHNPANENGFKITLGDRRLHGSALRRLVESEGARAEGGSERTLDLGDVYIDGLVEAIGEMRPLKVAWDCGSGAAGPEVERLARRLPGERVLLNTKVDGRFGAHAPDPGSPAAMHQLQEAVIACECDVGIAFDGDGDKIGVVDQNGRVLGADQLLLFLAADLLSKKPGATVVGDVKCSWVLFEGVRALGGRAVLAPTGYVALRDTAAREAANLAGEFNGHLFYTEGWNGGDDALYVAARLLRALSGGSLTLAAFLASLPPTLASPEVRIPCAEDRKAQVVSEVARRLREQGGVRVDTVDGVRVTTPDGWWLLRASASEAELSCRIEADDAAGLERLQHEVAVHLAASGVGEE
jgi:phosphomannomutase